jgi:hypothetical protein
LPLLSVVQINGLCAWSTTGEVAPDLSVAVKLISALSMGFVPSSVWVRLPLNAQHPGVRETVKVRVVGVGDGEGDGDVNPDEPLEIIFEDVMVQESPQVWFCKQYLSSYTSFLYSVSVYDVGCKRIKLFIA